jgi:hypothetical protein
MILNPETVENKFVCNKFLADYFIFEKNILPIGIKNGKYFFVKTDGLQKAYNDMPILYRILYKIV